MQDLNDLYYFAMVVEHGGFAAAERALGIPKSRLSRRISQLETDLGVRLLQRSTRRFAVTDVGMSVYRHAQTMLAEAQAAREVVDRLSAEPRGLVRVSVPVAIAQQQLPKLLPKFLQQYPKVRLQLHVNNRRVDLINEGFDVALRVRTRLDDDGSLVMRSFGQIQELMVASPKYLDRAGRPKDPSELASHLTLSMHEDEAHQRWELHGPNGEVRRVDDLQPRVAGFDFPLLLAMVKDGFGITMLPETVCAEAVRNGELEVVLPEWSLPQGICHAVFASRRGLLPAVRVFIDFLAEHLPKQIEASRLDCGNCGRKDGGAVAAAGSEIALAG
ncbi:LysR family transcriptional regulator [Pseudoxanthomonas sp. SGNA-20]|uniref:DNA-binding transcriptional LysR family regulator n=1 Tax=Pseudoxanthomonas taiwanensis J19 TaxID=935569 RepID=A0A562D5M1_9GAMM|nr:MULTISPECIES: LysR family transcriptional regulator [Pseudoxanthomonas]RRN57221.1 LysR family transcriptional regulator [Pseudoxanthomonas sp. SGNA-20]RRN80055.1 LysR family transcriptional regulator [Pseudoxanthomonas sp. SGD-10]TWH04844.1 DNA-binding transcriptional LysR family regulator [Pseudoxanthomonas taiwanensis J19]